MVLQHIILIGACLVASPAFAASSEEVARLINPSQYSKHNIIRRDVAVIGGGASGTYGAIALKDQGVSVMVVEKQDRMGGQVATYFEPTTGTPVDYGVQSYWNRSVTVQFFERFGIPPVVPRSGAGGNQYRDFSNGRSLPEFAPNSSLAGYSQQLNRWPSLHYGYNIPDPTPEDMLITYGEFITKYGLESEVWAMQPFLGGIANPSNVLDTVMLNMFIWFGRAFTDVALGDHVTTEKPYHYNSELYEKAQAELEEEDSVLLNATVIAGDRNCRFGPGICLAVKTPSGIKLVLAKKLLITIPPVPWNMIPFGLDYNELSLYSKFNYSGYYAGLLTNSGLEAGVTLWNAGADTPYNLPILPSTYFFSPTNVPGITMYWYGSPTMISEQEVQVAVTAEIRRLTGSATQTPQFLAFSDHSPFKLVVEAEDIAGGFYDDLLGLQGRKNTFYSGSAFVSHNSVVLWNYTANLVPDIITSLN
ncbi:hypothetical protein S40293_09075 [Stachybotrys chartarum IBT 40293]|nr:hypothetical protein S40293_09075 [Stachybotrys chartarum IBT 40293]